MRRSEAEFAGFGDRPALAGLVVPARVLAIAAVLALLAAVHVRHRPTTLCPVRSLTGLPCPFCGGTTAAVDLGRGQLRGALTASPLAVAMLAALPFARTFRRPTWWQSRRQLRWSILIVILVGSELWQLTRLHVIG